MLALLVPGPRPPQTPEPAVCELSQTRFRSGGHHYTPPSLGSHPHIHPPHTHLTTIEARLEQVQHHGAMICPMVTQTRVCVAC